MLWIDRLAAPLFVSWQLTRNCDLCCLHCCTDSAPGKQLPDELDAAEAMALADQIVALGVPYVMLCGGEPLTVPHFLALAQRLGAAGVQLKIETNGQRFDAAMARHLADLPIRSVQISLDGDTQAVYERQRPGSSLERAHAACAAVRDAGLPLEVTFAPSRLNLHEAERVVDRARALGAFRFNTGRLMRIGTAARHWAKLEPSEVEYAAYRELLQRLSERNRPQLELCFEPFSMQDGLRASLASPPATLQVLPNGWVKVSAALAGVCADLRRETLQQAWENYRDAWHDDMLRSTVVNAIADSAVHATSNRWQPMSIVRT
jgi:MoaA/NifB/PqqE/SkfB family radical SAM enzyme